MIIARNRITTASLIVGGVGALIAGFGGFMLWQSSEISGEFFNLPIGD